jgi:lipopolysaccharide transport system permease protein
LLFYLSPVFCPVELLRSRGLGVLVDWNPIAQFMELIRAPLLEGRPPTLWAIGLTSFITLLTMTTAYRLLRKYERTVIFRM